MSLDGTGAVVINPQEFLLGITHERVHLPSSSRLCARVEGRSTLARLGLGVHVTAPTIHAGWNGKIALEIAHHGNVPIRLAPGLRICQLIVLIVAFAFLKISVNCFWLSHRLLARDRMGCGAACCAVWASSCGSNASPASVPGAGAPAPRDLAVSPVRQIAGVVARVRHEAADRPLWRRPSAALIRMSSSDAPLSHAANAAS
jgi:hypothetical protein